MPQLETHCRDCKFFDGYQSAERPAVCLRFPPPPSPAYGWPKVSPAHKSCGEFTKKKETP